MERKAIKEDTMKRKFEFVDIMVSIGMVATLVGAYAFFQLGDGRAVTVNTTDNYMTNPPMNALVQAKLQPAIGQTIVDQARLERQFAADVSRGAGQLASAMRAAERPAGRGLDEIEVWAAQMEADHKARVQQVMGRSIISLTQQGMRSGALSADSLSNSVNDRIIETASKMGRKMEKAFARNWQPRLGQMIVATAKQKRRYTDHMQERIGKATVALASAQYAFQTKQSGFETQLKALTAAAERNAAQSEIFARLPKENLNWQRALGIPHMPNWAVVESQTSPGMPVTYLILATVGLVTMFFFGLTWPRHGRKIELVGHGREGMESERYRKAV
jgi:hypothetical protein